MRWPSFSPSSRSDLSRSSSSLSPGKCSSVICFEPPSHSDEIAQTALVWLTFAGAAYLYRERGHVEIDFMVDKLSTRNARFVFVVVELAILARMVMICIQVLQSRDVMQRVIYGTLRLPKFLLHFVPLLVSAVATIVFAIEAIAKHEKT